MLSMSTREETKRKAELWDELHRRTYEEIADKMSIEPIRAWLDKKEHRKGYLGIDDYSDEGIGPYYCIPLKVFQQCGMDDDEFWYGKTTNHKQTFKRRHICWKCEDPFVELTNEHLCPPCQEEYDRA